MGLARFAAVGDLDGDGDPDVLVNRNADIAVFANDGAGRFTEFARIQFNGPYPTELHLVDIDSDGDLDAIAGFYPGPTFVQALRNDGRGRLTPWAVGMPRLPDFPTSFGTGDFDGDNRADLVVTWNGGVSVWMNLGGATGFRLASTPTVNVTGIGSAIADFDGDNDLDILVGNQSSNLGHVLLRNDGRGVFVDIARTSLPLVPGYLRAVTAGDFDKDGSPDLFLSYMGTPNRVWLNNGRAVFSDASATFLPSEPDYPDFATVVFDAEGDGDLDVFVCGSTGGGSFPLANRNRLLINDQGRRFVPAPAGTVDGSFGTSTVAHVADFDRNGHADILVFNLVQEPELLLGIGGGALRNASAPPFPQTFESTASGTVGDMNGDGYPDLLLGFSTGQLAGVQIYPQVSPGRFGEASTVFVPLDAMPSVVVGDVDGDGDLDVVLATINFFTPVQTLLFLNGGSGSLTPAPAGSLPAIRKFARTAALFDADQDGDLDLFLGEEIWGNGDSLLLQNDGRGRFTVATGAIPANVACNAVQHGDVDGDGDLDLVIGGRVPRVLINDGRGVFSDAPITTPPTVFIHAVDLGDIDGDGDLDVLLGTGNPPWAAVPDRVLVNGGNAGFTALPASAFPAKNTINLGATFHDMDFDGDLDIVTQSSGDPLGGNTRFRSLYLNDGRGRFTDASNLEPNGLPLGLAIESVDIDLDGDADLLHFGPWVKVRSSLAREIHAPLLAGPGQNLRVDVWSRASRLSSTTAWMWIAPAALPRPVSIPQIGWLGINPWAALQLPAFALQKDRTELSLPVPRSSTFSGLTLHFQALIHEGVAPMRIRLTRRMAVQLLN